MNQKAKNATHLTVSNGPKLVGGSKLSGLAPPSPPPSTGPLPHWRYAFSGSGGGVVCGWDALSAMLKKSPVTLKNYESQGILRKGVRCYNYWTEEADHCTFVRVGPPVPRGRKSTSAEQQRKHAALQLKLTKLAARRAIIHAQLLAVDATLAAATEELEKLKCNLAQNGNTTDSPDSP